MDNALIYYYIIGIVSVLGACFIMYSVFVYRSASLGIWLMYLFLIIPGYMILAQLFKYYSLHFYADFEHWSELIHTISSIGKPLGLTQGINIPGTENYFSVHFVPLAYLLAVPFKIWPYSETIIVLNFLLMISSVIPLYQLTLSCHKDRRFALFMVVVLLWHPTFQYTVLYEFEILRFSIPIILWMLYFWEKKKMLGYYLFVLLAVLVREEVGLTIMMFGIYLILIVKEHRTGLITALIGVVAFATITQMIMPALRGTNLHQLPTMSLFSAFGISIGEIILNVIKKPILVLETISHPIKLANAFMFFLPLLFIPFLAPTILIAILANFGVGLLSRYFTHTSYMLYYLSPSIPFIFYAFIKAWPKLLTWLRAWTPKRYISRVSDLNSPAMAAVFSGLLVTNVFFGPSPLSLQFWFEDLRPAPFRTQDFHYSVYMITDHHRKVEEFSRLIPDSATVSSQQFLFPRLFKKRGCMMFPKVESKGGLIKADYVLFDKTNNGIKEASPAYIVSSDFDLIEKDTKNWKLVKSEDGYYLYKNKLLVTSGKQLRE